MTSRNTDARNTKAPNLPAELWLQILESMSDIEHLWTSIRLVSTKHRSYVERTFLSNKLKDLSVSLSLPRHDPSTGALLYRDFVPGAEIVMAFAGLNLERTHAILQTPIRTRNGVHIEKLTDANVLSQRRLEEAAVWLWFGRERLKGVAVTMDKSMTWDGTFWTWTVEWKNLIGAYIRGKRLKRRSLQTNEKREPRRIRSSNVRVHEKAVSGTSNPA